ncbi:SymE family type I addiction module toxin [Pectobacterium carotovorum]
MHHWQSLSGCPHPPVPESPPYPATTRCHRSPPHRWWLEKLSFNTDQPVIVTVERGRLVIETELRF